MSSLSFKIVPSLRESALSEGHEYFILCLRQETPQNASWDLELIEHTAPSLQQKSDTSLETLVHKIKGQTSQEKTTKSSLSFPDLVKEKSHGHRAFQVPRRTNKLLRGDNVPSNWRGAEGGKVVKKSFHDLFFFKALHPTLPVYDNEHSGPLSSSQKLVEESLVPGGSYSVQRPWGQDTRDGGHIDDAMTNIPFAYDAHNAYLPPVQPSSVTHPGFQDMHTRPSPPSSRSGSKEFFTVMVRRIASDQGEEVYQAFEPTFNKIMGYVNGELTKRGTVMQRTTYRGWRDHDRYLSTESSVDRMGRIRSRIEEKLAQDTMPINWWMVKGVQDDGAGSITFTELERTGNAPPPPTITVDETAPSRKKSRRRGRISQSKTGRVTKRAQAPKPSARADRQSNLHLVGYSSASANAQEPELTLMVSLASENDRSKDPWRLSIGSNGPFTHHAHILNGFNASTGADETLKTLVKLYNDSGNESFAQVAFHRARIFAEEAARDTLSLRGIHDWTIKSGPNRQRELAPVGLEVPPSWTGSAQELWESYQPSPSELFNDY